MLIGLFLGGNMFPSIPLLQLGDFKLEQMQKNVVGAINNMNKVPFLNGNLLQKIALSGTETQINHKLNRDYQGFIITNLNANAVVWISSTGNKSQTINLTASASCTIDIWVF